MKTKTILCLLLIFIFQSGYSQTKAIWKIKQDNSIQKSEKYNTEILSANHKLFELNLVLVNPAKKI